MALLSFLAAKQRKQERATESAALDWILRVSEDPEAESACEAWRESDPMHEQAWNEVSAVWERTGELGSLERDDWRGEMEALTRGAAVARKVQWGLAVAASLIAAVGLGWFSQLPDAQYATSTGQDRRVALSDGSQLTIGAQSNVELRFGDDERRVVLRGGQAFFEVAHDASRPFTVVAGDAEVRVTGTKFDVRRSDSDVTVSVLEGRVEVRRHSLLPSLASAPPALVLTPGLRSSLPAGSRAFTAPRKDEVPAGDWRGGRFFYHDATLSRIVWDAGRYSSKPIRIADPSVAALKVTTSFQVGEIEQFLDNLATILPVRKGVAADGTIVLEAQPGMR